MESLYCDDIRIIYLYRFNGVLYDVKVSLLNKYIYMRLKPVCGYSTTEVLTAVLCA